MNADHLSVTYKNGNVSRVYKSDGTHFGNVSSFNGFSKLLGEPRCAYLSEKYLQLGDWRIGATDIDHLSVTHKGGKTALIYRSDGQAFGGPRDDFNPWEIPTGTVIMGTTNDCPEDARFLW